MSNDLVAFTYNVCWGCMKSDHTSSSNRTAKLLAEYCYRESQKKKHNVCLKNVCDIIDGTNKDLHKQTNLTMDIIGLQEATNFNLIHDFTPFLKNNMLRVSSTQVMEDIVSFYDYKKYKLEAATFGNLSINPSDGRPFQILFLQLNSNPLEKLIFINLHRSQYSSVNIGIMQHLISNSLLFGIITSGISNYDFGNITPNDDLSGILDTYKNAKIIMLGDFNDQGRNFWNGTFIPFKHTNPKYNLNTIVVKTSTKPPNTCCTGGSSLRQNSTREPLISDYILVSDNIAEINSNIIPQNPPFNRNAKTTPSSDHLPVLSILKTRQPPKAAAVPPPPPPPPPSAPPPQQQAPPPPQSIIFNIVGSKILRLANNLSNPAHTEKMNLGVQFPFRGNTLRKDDNIVYPCGRITDNGLVYVCCLDNPNIIGYIQYKYLDTSTIPVTIKKDIGPKTLRLLDNLADPNTTSTIDGMLHSGITINNEFKLSFPCGEVQPDTGLVIVQNRDDNNVIGYIQNKYLRRIIKGGKKKFKKKKR